MYIYIYTYVYVCIYVKHIGRYSYSRRYAMNLTGGIVIIQFKGKKTDSDPQPSTEAVYASIEGPGGMANSQPLGSIEGPS